jgi:hypothetical protein
VPNSEIEPMLIHPTKRGYRNNKNKNKMKNRISTEDRIEMAIVL